MKLHVLQKIYYALFSRLEKLVCNFLYSSIDHSKDQDRPSLALSIFFLLNYAVSKQRTSSYAFAQHNV